MKSNQKRTRIIMAVSILVLILIVLNYKSKHYYIPLPGGYVIHYSSVEQTSGAMIRYVAKSSDYPDKIAVGPNVAYYRVYSTMVTGHIDRSYSPYFRIQLTELQGEKRLGYFIIDLRTKKVYGGLSMRDWMRKLRAYGITEEPKLHKPSWLDMYLGRNKPDR